jgi:hypothetical protein
MLLDAVLLEAVKAPNGKRQAVLHVVQAADADMSDLWTLRGFYVGRR